MVKSMIPVGLVALFLSIPVSAVRLWATSYNDHALTTLSLTGSSLGVVSKDQNCGSEPTWLTLDSSRQLLYCLNEGWGGAASLSSYKVNANSIDNLDVLPVLKSPVASSVYGPNGAGLAVAHYDTSTFSSFDVSDASNLALAQNETYTLSAPGPVADRQEAPHLHHTIVDPKGKYILVPDLGSDLIRVYEIGSSSIAWKQLAAQKATAGSGPRHGTFAGSNFFYSLNELSNTITGYKVNYSSKGLTLSKLFDIPSHGPGGSVPAGTKAAELVTSPDGKFIIASSRGENLLTIPSFDGTGNIPSDPLVVFKVNSNGSLTLVQVASAGGRNPRGFGLNKAGTLVASALQDDNRVVIIERNTKTGKLGNFVAWATVGEGEGNGPNYVLFDE